MSLIHTFVSGLLCWLFVVLCALISPALAEPDLRGHGGPVRSLAVRADGTMLISGSFDASAILWKLEKAEPEIVLRAHEGAVSAVLALPDGHFVTGGEDGRVIIWTGDGALHVERARHQGPVAALAATPDGRTLASASWDGTIKVFPVTDDSEPSTLTVDAGIVNGVAFLADGSRIASAGSDGTLRLWSLAGGSPQIVSLPTLLASLAAGHAGELIAGGSDGSVFFVTPEGVRRLTVDAATGPVIALAASVDGTTVAAASPRGAVSLIDSRSGMIVASLAGPGLAVWSLAFTPDGKDLLTGSGDGIIRRWDAVTGDYRGDGAPVRAREAPVPLAGSRGAEIFRACSVCHALGPDGGNRSGPTLHGIFGRRVGTAKGYEYSAALRELDFIWDAESISRLFEIGPTRFTPGTKMPEQTLPSAEDRAALSMFLQEATKTAP